MSRPFPVDHMIEAQEIAALLKQGSDFVQRRMVNPKHPEYIPNAKIGRKRFVKISDLQAWIDKRITR